MCIFVFIFLRNICGSLFFYSKQKEHTLKEQLLKLNYTFIIGERLYLLWWQVYINEKTHLVDII